MTNNLQRVVQYPRHGTFRPGNVLQVEWRTRGDATDTEEYLECSRIV